MRLDRFLANLPEANRRRAQEWLATGQVRIDGAVERDGARDIGPFARVELGQRTLQQRRPRYLMLNKPAGYLSATVDPLHPTVLQLIAAEERAGLHIAGRLDRASTGLLLLTDDGAWSRRLTLPGQRVAKVYRVDTAHPIHPDTARRFAEGIPFPFEGITTRPVALQQLGERRVRLTLFEGRYHQIKRMFGRFRNPVLALHREQIGALALDPALAPGDYRPLRDAEVAAIHRACAVAAGFYRG